MARVIDRLESFHYGSAFCCGEAALDTYIAKQARQDAERGLSVCYVLHEEGDSTIVGFYTLSATSVEPASIDPAIAKKFGHYPVLPATLIGKLAVDHAFQSQRIGELLLADAVKHALAGSKTEVGSALIVVEALDDRARSFYRHFGFQTIPDDDRRLYLPMAHVRTTPAYGAGPDR
jgi:GNAT superfamily N-acetyltransferase